MYNIDIKEISAEMLLNYLYPELEDKWVAHNEGAFFRNYNSDLLKSNAENGEIILSRDGFLNLLPQGFISSEDELKIKEKGEKIKEIEQRRKILAEAFLPVDTLVFRQKLKFERTVSEILNCKLKYVLKNYFDFDLSKESNPYVREFAVLLPYIRNRRGDLNLIKSVLKYTFECEVELFTGRISQSDSTKVWLPVVRYELIKNDLNKNQLKNLLNLLSPLKKFLQYWFIPAEAVLQLEVKQHGVDQKLDGKLFLGYNTEINVN